MAVDFSRLRTPAAAQEDFGSGHAFILHGDQHGVEPLLVDGRKVRSSVEKHGDEIGLRQVGSLEKSSSLPGPARVDLRAMVQQQSDYLFRSIRAGSDHERG